MMLSLFVFGCAGWRQHELFAVEYTAGSLRDPFSDLTPPQVVSSTLGEDIPALVSALQLQGVVVGTGESRAIIDGKIVRVGNKLKIGEVANISKEGVTVSYNGVNYFKRAEKKGIDL